MYQYSLLKTRGLKALSDIQSTSANHTRQFPLALAYVLSHKLAVPPEEIEDIRSYFRLQHWTSINTAISDFNELLPHNTKQTMEDIRALYSYRYTAIHPKKIPLILSPDNAVFEFFELSKTIPLDAIKAIQENPQLLTRLIHGLSVIDEDITETRVAQQSRDCEASSETSNLQVKVA